MWWEVAGEFGVLDAGELLWDEVPEETFIYILINNIISYLFQ